MHAQPNGFVVINAIVIRIRVIDCRADDEFDVVRQAVAIGIRLHTAGECHLNRRCSGLPICTRGAKAMPDEPTGRVKDGNVI